MTINFRNAGTLALVMLVAACATGSSERSAAGGTSVTRFHLGTDIARGAVAIEPRFATQSAGGAYEPAFASAVAGELRTLGFTDAAPSTPSEYVVTVDVASGGVPALIARAPASGGAVVEAATPGATATQLAVQLKRRSDGSIVWEGRSRRTANPAPPASAATVQMLARALFADFPGVSGRTTMSR